MASPKSGFLHAQLNFSKKRKRNKGDSSSSQTDHLEDYPNIPEDVLPTEDPTPSTNEGTNTETSITSQRRQGSNKNFELAKLTANGEKVSIRFDPVEGKPCCKNMVIWNRHLGAIIRENNIIPHCTVQWRHISPTILNNLWQSVIDKFESEDIESYRNDTLRHMKTRWEDWRYIINAKKIRPNDGNVEAIRADKPNKMTLQDWLWLLENYFFTDKFQDELRHMRIKCLNISNMDLVEGVFDPQDKGKFIGMGSILASHIRGPTESKKQLIQENLTLQKQLNDLEEMARQEREEHLQERQEREQRQNMIKEQVKAEIMQMMSQMCAGGSQFNPAMFSQFVGQSSSPSSSSELHVQPPQEREQMQNMIKEQVKAAMMQMMSQMCAGGYQFNPAMFSQFIGQPSGTGSSSEPHVQPPQEDDNNSEEEDED